jgi:hypothetical protein
MRRKGRYGIYPKATILTKAGMEWQRLFMPRTTKPYLTEKYARAIYFSRGLLDALDAA